MPRRWPAVPPSYVKLVEAVLRARDDGRSVPCMSADPDMWHDEEREASAKSLCSPCPAALECFLHACSGDEHGVWGGTTRVERRRMVRSMRQ